jgi:hypothetical protein
MKDWGRHNMSSHQLNISQMLAKLLSHGHQYQWDFWKKTCNAACTWELIDIFLICNPSTRLDLQNETAMEK